MALQLVVYDDAVARSWMPFALTRPVGELLSGARTFRERCERFAGAACAGHLAGADLEGFIEVGCRPAITPSAVDRARPRLYLNSRAVPDPTARFVLPTGSGAVTVGAQVAGWYAAAGEPGPDPELLLEPAAWTGPVVHEVPGSVLSSVWDLVTGNEARIAADFESADAGDAPLADAPSGVAVVGDARGRFRIAPDVRIEPGVVLDVSAGPIWLEAGVVIRAFTRLAGPAWIGPGSTVLGGVLSGVSIGPVCKVHGEVEASVVLGYSNKAHDGFLGHAYLGRWVNLGALTTNSDLKNNYGSVRIWTPAGEVDTGVRKLGCLLGDHVKTGIGVMLNTGTVAGAASNLFGALQPPKYVPPFRWGGGDAPAIYDFDRFLGTATIAMGRRGVTLQPGLVEVLRRAFARATGA